MAQVERAVHHQVRGQPAAPFGIAQAVEGHRQRFRCAAGPEVGVEARVQQRLRAGEEVLQHSIAVSSRDIFPLQCKLLGDTIGGHLTKQGLINRPRGTEVY